MNESDKFKQAGKYLGQKIDQNEYNTRRIRQVKPRIERKLDVISQLYSFYMPFKTTSGSSRVHAVIRFKPDNCCECSPGAQSVARDCIATLDSGSFGPSDGTAYPALIAEPLEQTGTNFNYGYSSPFFYHIYQDFPYIANYEISADSKGIVMPVDGVYNILFQAAVDYFLDSDSYIRLQIRKNGTDILSQKLYSFDTVVEDSHLKETLYQYALCRVFRAGDVVNAWVDALTPSEGQGINIGSSNTRIKINLVGLGYATIIGTVFDQASGDPIVGATVSYSEGFGGSTTTDSEGRYTFTEIRPATYNLTASSTGYIDMTRTVVAVMGEVTVMDFNLTQE